MNNHRKPKSTAKLTLQSDRALIAKQRRDDQYILDNPDILISFSVKAPESPQDSQTQDKEV